MLTCKELTELLTEYLEGSMPLMQRLELRVHLMMCKNCRAYVRQAKMTIATLGKLPAEPLPDAVREQLLQHYRKSMGSARRKDGESKD